MSAITTADGGSGLTVDSPTDLSPSDLDALTALIVDATETDGVAPLNEQTRLHLAAAPGIVRHFTARMDGRVVGYAQLEAPAVDADNPTMPGVELVVAPSVRRTGVGTALVRAARTSLGSDRALQVWAHGTIPAARAMADSLGFVPVRQLLQLNRRLSADSGPAIVAPPAPDGIAIRTFVPDQDEDAWLRVNAAAFAHHPEQGRWTLADLVARERESWFDPDGFFLAERVADERVIGFHWTKIDDGVGEVYVVGIDPAAQGGGLGKLLLLTGLEHLQRRGCSGVDLYVEADNLAARTLYERQGFEVVVTDTQYRLGS